MSKKQTTQESQPEGRFGKVKAAGFWFLVLVVAVFPFPFWP